MLFDRKEIATRHYSILLKNADKTMVICAEEMKKPAGKDYYEFYINDNLVSMLPVNVVENIV